VRQSAVAPLRRASFIYASTHLRAHLPLPAVVAPLSPRRRRRANRAHALLTHRSQHIVAGRKNCFGSTVSVTTMQSEAGAAGAVHGALTAGSMSTTFTASQGLLLMIPNLYLIAGELMPCVIHVSARAVAKHALTIFNDHSDVMACRQTGFVQLCSHSVQEVMDLALVSHLSSMKARLPFMHFFDGYRTSAEIKKINVIPYDAIEKLIPQEALQKNLRDVSLNPNHPIIRGTGQRPDIFFQNTVAAHGYYLRAPALIQETMNEVGAMVGRPYQLCDYHGAADADRVIVVMGSASETVNQAVTYLNAKGEKVGVVKLRLFRPWPAEMLMKEIPASVKTITVLDRTREDGALGCPVYLDVAATCMEAGRDVKVIGGQFGLASKEFTPNQAVAAFDNMNAETPHNKFVLGINDDVTHTSLAVGPDFNSQPEGTRQCLFWGLGTDGTVGANKQAIKTIGKHTDMYTQGHFAFDSHKGGGVTMSHLRFGPEELQSPFEIHNNADYIACGNTSFINKFDILKAIGEGGKFLLNCPWKTVEELDANLPAVMKRHIAQRNVDMYVVDATTLARDVGLGQRINMVMQAGFYILSGVLPEAQALELLKSNIETMYGKKGPKIVQMNKDCVDATKESLIPIQVPASWGDAQMSGNATGVDRVLELRNISQGANSWGATALTANGGDQARGEHHLDYKDPISFTKAIMDPVLALEGDDLPVSVFTPGGYMPSGTCNYEKRGIAPAVPVWKEENCTQCNYCTIVCPHAVIRPFLFTKDELKTAPDGFRSVKAQGGAEVAGLNYSINLATMDCTGCEVCVESCPDDALHMHPFSEAAQEEVPMFEFAMGIPNKGSRFDKFSVKGSQFQQPLMEFSGACAGCGETPYVKLVTQLFGDRMMIANASGCSSVWGGTSTTNPYTINEEGKGPAWGRSLFEDNAEYGLGMALATQGRRKLVAIQIENALDDPAVNMTDGLRGDLQGWLSNYEDADKCAELIPKIEAALADERAGQPLLDTIFGQTDMMSKSSQWIIGGDGWAYDIGYGGLDHVFAKGENVNVLVLDTEMYSNTGGQVSKSTQAASVVKYASSGKATPKKDLGQMAMMYENVYVASIALGADMGQSVAAIREAEEYPGTSLIIAYSPCIDWGIDMTQMMQVQKAAVDSGYWSIYRYDPRRIDAGEAPFQLDSRRIKVDLQDFLSHENRFASLTRGEPERAEMLQTQLKKANDVRMKKHQRMSMDDYEMLDTLKAALGESVGEKILILYASETGNTADAAKMLAYEMKRRDVRTSCMPMDDFDIADLPTAGTVISLAATCGQGEFPQNCRLMMEALKDDSLPSDYLADLKVATFALGDSGYVFYNNVGTFFHERMVELGAGELIPLGLGDDQAEDKWETAWDDWFPELCGELGTSEPSKELLPAHHDINLQSTNAATMSQIMPSPEAQLLTLQTSEDLTPGGRDVRHYEWDISGTNMTYECGDALGVWSTNGIDKVADFLDWYGLDKDQCIDITDKGSADRAVPLPATATAGQLFSQVLDIFGRPKRQFYEVMELLATDEAEKEELARLVSKDGKGDMRNLINDTTNYADLMQKFPSAKVPLDYLLDFCPAIKPRLYSIASAPEMHPNHIELCVVEEDWEVQSTGEQRRGQSTWCLRNSTPGMVWGDNSTETGLLQQVPAPPDPFGRVGKEGPQLPCFVNAGVVHLPDDPKTPLVMVGLGTGLAPFRSFIQQRKVMKDAGDEVGDCLLYFGARFEATEFMYGAEIEEYVEDGVLTHLKKAFSRDQEHKIYAQTRIEEDPHLIYDYMVNRNGSFYLCGPAGNMPKQMKEAVVNAFCVAGGHSQEEATNMVDRMQITGKYNVEVW
jgi:sulfite reductase alpha subunit-like flavoprotein/pyruvate/2-oxoacid:ferredoxin oxidoreductase beta subunit/pyruvate/2-oxoacid:ferredoxin oxidoreductase alpha subunit/Pyruvate/2-oxoacid:ferredoxin oxidoreductase gamma subunit/Pyruvate/2-oxoacid:ferredoxin oxidoreductase delta subunit